jgi:hypothetical protein
VTKNSSQSLCLGWSISTFCWLAFQEKVLSFFRTLKNCNNPLNLRGQSYKRRLLLFVRILEGVIGGNGSVVFLLFYFVK